MIIFLVFIVFIVLLIMVTGYSISGPRYRGPVSDHFDGRRFINPTGIKAKGLSEVLKWMLDRKRMPWTESKESPGYLLPVQRVEHGIRVTFVNHSTFLIQVDGLNILTDPVFSKRTSPFEWVGPKRMRPPGIRFEDLPSIDVLLLSHNHWDHLDIKYVRRICKKDHPLVFTPLGVKAFLEENGITTNVTDLDWWQDSTINVNIKIQAVPAQHFSGRGTFDRDATLWCGYMIRRPAGNLYFAGDTGYNEMTFKQIGERCSPIEVSFIPIGAFKPEWFMSPIHCSPAEALKIHADVRSKTSIAMHFGTFSLADDNQNEPIIELKQAMRDTGILPEKFRVLTEGEPVQL